MCACIFFYKKIKIYRSIKHAIINRQKYIRLYLQAYICIYIYINQKYLSGQKSLFNIRLIFKDSKFELHSITVSIIPATSDIAHMATDTLKWMHLRQFTRYSFCLDS